MDQYHRAVDERLCILGRQIGSLCSAVATSIVSVVEGNKETDVTLDVAGDGGDGDSKTESRNSK
jgi:hypothetical protein